MCDVEFVVEYLWRVVFMMMFVVDCDDVCDLGCVVVMVFVYDFVEVVVGDIMLNDGVSDEEKVVMEWEVMGTMTAALGARGEALMVLWEEYEVGESVEVRLVKDMDKLEMIV